MVHQWHASSRYLEEKWQSEHFQSHRARLDAIQATKKHKPMQKHDAIVGERHPAIKALAKAPTAHLYCQRGSTTAPKIIAKSKSPAAKSRQQQIERDNMKMIKKILSLQRKKPLSATSQRMPLTARSATSNASTTTTTTTASTSNNQGSRPSSASKPAPPDLRARPKSASATPALSSQPTVCGRSCTPQKPPLHPPPLPDVPSRASHALYTSRSATMKNNFPNQNASTMRHTPAVGRQQTQVKIMDENRKLLQRILTTKTTFSRATWQQQEKERLKLLSNISRHAYTKPTTPQPKLKLLRSASASEHDILTSGPRHLTLSTSAVELCYDDPKATGTIQKKQRPRSAATMRMASRSPMRLGLPLTARNSNKVGCDMLITGMTQLHVS